MVQMWYKVISYKIKEHIYPHQHGLYLPGVCQKTSIYYYLKIEMINEQSNI